MENSSENHSTTATHSNAKRREIKSRQARKNALKELNEQGKFCGGGDAISTKVSHSKFKLAVAIGNSSTSSSKKSTENEVEALFEGTSRFSTSEAVGSSSCYSQADEATPRSVSSEEHNVGKDLEEKPVKSNPSSKPKNTSYIFQNYQIDDQIPTHLSSNYKHDQQSAVASNIATEAKLSSIMSYLDKVENDTSKMDLNPDQTSWNNEIGEIEEKTSEITQEMLKMKFEFEEKKLNVDLLEKALDDQRTTMERKTELHDEDLQRQLKMQKQQYEATIQRHLTFIDQLIDDKKVLNSKCEDFVKELKTLDEKYQRKIKTMTDNHKVETKKMKENVLASEKLFREQWVKEKTNRIKEMTVKGLEPEIQRLMARHKEDLNTQKSNHDAEMSKLHNSLENKFREWKESYRLQAENDKESLCKREVELTKERYERQLEEAEISFQVQKRKIYEEKENEKEQMKQWSLKKENEVELVKMQLRGNNELSATQFKSEFEKKAAEIRLEYEEEIRRLKRKLENEKSAWQESFSKHQEAILQQKERELRDLLRVDRDKEINMVVRKLEEEMQLQREELEQSTENRIKRVKKKYETEVNECEKSERELQEKYVGLKTSVNEMTDENLRLKSFAKSKDIEIEEMTAKNEKLASERSNVTQFVRTEFSDQIESLQSELQSCKENLSQTKHDWRSEVEDLKIHNSQELSTVDERVRKMMERKDEAIAQFRLKSEAATKRADHLEEMFEQQRKRLLGGSTASKKKK